MLYSLTIGAINVNAIEHFKQKNCSFELLFFFLYMCIICGQNLYFSSIEHFFVPFTLKYVHYLTFFGLFELKFIYL